MDNRVKFNDEELLTILQRISKDINVDLTGYLIGGLAMIYHGVKAATKDIDIVFTSDTDAELFIGIMEKHNFVQERVIADEYEKLKDLDFKDTKKE